MTFDPDPDLELGSITEIESAGCDSLTGIEVGLGLGRGIASEQCPHATFPSPQTDRTVG